jgi:hypothetical protein
VFAGPEEAVIADGRAAIRHAREMTAKDRIAL